MEKYILAIDQGTTSTRAILINKEGKVLDMAQKEVPCLFPKPAWVEVDALTLWISVIDVVNTLMIKQNIMWDSIDSIGITNQRETTVVWDKKTGLPICPAIVWQSRQSLSICEQFEEQKDFIHERTGLLINPYFSASKIKYILDNVKGAKEKANKGELLFGTVDSWIIYKMTKQKVHATDISNASRTMLYNINTKQWDKELCKLFDIPMSMLPTVLPSSFDYGAATFFDNSVHIHGVAGDQQAALFGHTCFKPGESKNTYGTGCFMLMNTGKVPVYSKHGLLTTIAWQIGDEVTYALEGSVFVGGAVVQWLRDKLHMIDNSSESERISINAKTCKGIYVIPAFTGLGTPYWDDEVRGAIFGLSRDTTDAQIVRASLESIAYQCKDVIETMNIESKNKLKCLKVDGGATTNNFLMQFQSDILSTNVSLAECVQNTALGVSYIAGLSSGFFKNLKEILSIHKEHKVFTPQMSEEAIEERYNGWKKAIKAAQMFK